MPRSIKQRCGRLTRRAALAALGAGLSTAPFVMPAMGQGYPQARQITLVVPFAAGGGTDAIARALAELLRERLGQSVIVENQGGGGGSIAAQRLKNASPDGHTLMLATSTFVTAAAAGRNLPYDILADFTPVSLIGSGPMVIVVNKDLGVATLPAFVQRLKDRPGELNYVSSGTGSVTHLAGELFLQRTGTKMTHIPYRGSGPALSDLLGGRGHAFFATVPTILGQIQGKSVTLLAVTSKERSRLFPDAPTVASFGIDGYDVGTWWGVMAPPDLPQPILAALSTAINDAAGHPNIVKRFEEEGATPFRGSPADFGKALAAELAGWRKVVHDGNIKLE
jgi:tripartite-type tricarboxylate transporter receptor subunit TctC